MQWVVLGIVVATLAAIVARPRGIGAAWPAAVGGIAMLLLGVVTLAEAGDVLPQVTYGALVGANIGPTLTTYGSLATMLWLTLIRKRGVYVSTTMSMRVALFTTPIALFTTTLALWPVPR